MKYFKLPDLGEGLTEAEIVQWHIKVGDTVQVDQLMLSVETAKAIVEIPSPQAGNIAALFGEEADVIHTGEPLVEYAGEVEDAGTVVGDLSLSVDKNGSHDDFIIGSAYSNEEANVSPGCATNGIKATPSVRALASRLNVNLSHIKGSGDYGRITLDDVEKALALNDEKGDSETLKGVRKSMALAMMRSHQQVVPVTLHDEVDIHAWKQSGVDVSVNDETNLSQDITMRLVHAIAAACEAEPAMNTWFDGEKLTRRVLKNVDLGIAVDTDKGLFVPVLRNINTRALDHLRKGLDALREAVQTRKIPASEMQGATMTLTNFGTLSGKHATPIVLPPQVTIVGAGGVRDCVVAYKGQIVVHTVLPISMSFDHRAVTGGEAARFLKVLTDDLKKPNV